ncbi:exonuclease domain-containing protein [Radiobacillus sp. PE A8.2]|uniref:exonuclease domain-containing protein n=1 Tax=Radiobacillus sp. PE A8.2 TaxID=3380349 RepID=UPI00388EF8BC
MKSFVAFDFETANANRHSICSVGLTFVEKGEIVDSIYSLINPEEHFDGYNTIIHGITESDVKNAPTFDAFYEKVKTRLDNKILVAHYLPFDGYALRDNLTRYGLTPVNHELLCTYQLSKRLLLNQSSYSLDYLCNHYSIPLENHHNALDDSNACANLLISLANEFQLNVKDDIERKAFINIGSLSPDGFKSSLVKKVKKSVTNIEYGEETANIDADENHIFYKKHIVFTGKLQAYTRAEAVAAAAEKGGITQKGVTKNTNIIVLGEFQSAMIKGNKSSKLVKAEKLIIEGQPMEIISEAEFLKML